MYHGGYQSICFPMYRLDIRSDWIGEAYIHEVPDGIKHQSLRFSVRDWNGSQYVQAIVQAQDGYFYWDPAFCTKSEYFDVWTYKHCVGASSEYQLRFTSKSWNHFYPLSLELTRHPLSLSEEMEVRLEARQRIVLKTVGLPILDLVTTMDFDDAAGVILLGSCRGQICFVQFDTLLQKRGLINDLPAVRSDFPDVPRVSFPLPLCSELVSHFDKQRRQCPWICRAAISPARISMRELFQSMFGTRPLKCGIKLVIFQSSTRRRAGQQIGLCAHLCRTGCFHFPAGVLCLWIRRTTIKKRGIVCFDSTSALPATLSP